LKRLVKILLFVFVFVVSYTLFLVATLPAEKAWRIASLFIQVNRLPVRPVGFKGTIWSGSALIRYQSISGVLSWNISFDQWTQRRVALGLHWYNGTDNVKARLAVSPSRLYLNVMPSYVGLKPLTPLFRRQRIWLDGILKVRNLEIVTDGQKIYRAEGNLTWTGGDIRYPEGYLVKSQHFPAFGAVVYQKNQNTYVDIKDANSSINAISAEVNPEGWATVTVKRRLLDVAHEQWPNNVKATATVFKIKQKILPFQLGSR
jgi:hypothetical protein